MEGKKKKKSNSQSPTAWSTQVADSQETDLIMLLVTMLCPYSGWHCFWQRPPLHSNQETKCRRAPQSPVGGSLANHLPGFREKQQQLLPCHTALRHQADRACSPPRRLRSSKGRKEEKEADRADRQVDRALATFALPGRPSRAEFNKGADRLQLGPA